MINRGMRLWYSITRAQLGFTFFHIYYLTFSACPGYGETFRGNKTAGVITSPHYPDVYPQGVWCPWPISVTKGKQIELIVRGTYERSLPYCIIASRPSN